MKRLSKIFYCCVAVLCLASIHCTDSIDKSPVISVEPGPDIDAVSSASGKLRVMGGLVGTHSVSVDIFYLYDNGDTWIRFGTKAALLAPQTGVSPIRSTSTIYDTLVDSVSYGPAQSLNKAPNFFLKDKINRLTRDGLQSGTTYHFWIYGTKSGLKWEIRDTCTTRK